MNNTIVGAGTVGAGTVGAGAGAGAASRYGSGSDSDQKMWLLASPAPQHCSFIIMNLPLNRLN
jgi:hypothetical protein